MNAATVFRVLSLIPERQVRSLSGLLFTQEQAARAAEGDRVAYVSRFLHWLSPLNPITREDQRALGLLAPHARLEQAGDDESGEELEAAADEALEPALETEEPGMDLALPADTQPLRRTA